MEPRGSLSESRSGRGTRVREAGGFSCGLLGLRLLPAQGMLLACEDLHARAGTPSSFLWLLLRGMVEEEGEDRKEGEEGEEGDWRRGQGRRREQGGSSRLIFPPLSILVLCCGGTACE